MTQLFVNNFSAAVAQTFGASDQYLYLNSAAGLPALTGGNHLLLTVFRKVGIQESGHEVVKVTAITGNMLTVERSLEGAPASLFNAGDRVEARVTAASLEAKADAADAYVHPSAHAASMITQDASNRFVTDAEKEIWNAKQAAGNYATGGGTATGTNTGDQTNITGNAGTATALSAGADRTKLDGIEAGANNYVHPSSHPASIITQDASNRFVTDTEKAAWNSKGSSDVTLTGVQTLTNKTLTGPTETVYAVTGTTPAITVSNGSIQTWTLTANSTPTYSISAGQSVILMVTAGSYSITWPTTSWAKVGGSGAAPALTATGATTVVLWKVGSTVYGALLGSV